MDRADALARLAGERSGHLGTVRPDGTPHVVVVTFALSNGRIVTAIDHKPKRTDRLQRVINIEANPSVTFLVDHYEDDWDRLWWVRIDGRASISSSGDVRDAAIVSLSAKYEQYRSRPPQGPAIVVEPDRVISWSSTP